MTAKEFFKLNVEYQSTVIELMESYADHCQENLKKAIEENICHLSIDRSDPHHDVRDYESLMRSDYESIVNGIIESIETYQSSTDRNTSQWIDISLYGFPPAMPNDHYSERVMVTDGMSCEVARYGLGGAGEWTMLDYCITPTHWRKLSLPKNLGK